MDRKKLKTTFALLYITSLVVLILIFITFWNNYGPSRQTVALKTGVGSAEAYDILKKDASLHKGLIHLQQLDAKYALLFANSANKKSLDSLNELISKSEDSFSNTIEDVQNQRDKFSIVADKSILDSVANFFRIALNNRRSNSFMRTAIASLDGNSGMDQRELLKLKLDVSNKNDQILSLENRIKSSKNDAPVNSSSEALDAAEQKIQSLEADVTNTKRLRDTLISQTKTLLKENSLLAAQVNGFKTNSSEYPKKITESNADMLNKIEDLKTKLAFAQVDCSLTRADPRQIISNSKQRKDLLQEALNSLNNFVHSTDLSVQKKAKEKLVQLQSIASAAHD